MPTEEYPSSPEATGGAGTTFEVKVGARFLALLLLHGIPGVLTQHQVTQVAFQNRYRGWATDDLLVGCTDESGTVRKIAIQSKRGFTVSASNPECIKTFSGFWTDFRAPGLFDPELDILVLVVQRATNVIMKGLGGLLACARAASDHTDFRDRLNTPRFVSNDVRKAAEDIKQIIESSETPVPSEPDFWRFLKCIFVLPLDLDTSSAQEEATIKQILAQAVNPSVDDPIGSAQTGWLQLVDLAQHCNQGAQLITYADLPKELQQQFRPVGSLNNGLQILRYRSDRVLADVRSTIGGDVSVPRAEVVTQVVEALSENSVVLLEGPPGAGKSAVAKELVQGAYDDCVSVSFWGEDFAIARLDDVFSPFTLSEFESLIWSQHRVLVHVERAERILEHETDQAFRDLLNLVEQFRNLRLLLTCRDYAAATLLTSYVQPRTQSYQVVEIPLFTDQEVDRVVRQIPSLHALALSDGLKRLLHNPYYLSIAASIDWPSEQTELPNSATELRRRFWRQIVRREDYTAGDLPRRRHEALVSLAVDRAKALRPFVPMNDSDHEALQRLHHDGLVQINEVGHFAPDHDVIEDWALESWLDKLAEDNDWQAGPIADAVARYPALRRGFRRWLTAALQHRSQLADPFVALTYADPALNQVFRDDVLVAVMQAPDAPDFFARQRRHLMSDDGALLLRLIHFVRVACTKPDPTFPDIPGLPSLLLVPNGSAWHAILEVVAEGLDHLLPDHLESVVGLIEDWARGLNWDDLLPNGSEAFAAIAYRLLDYLGDYGARTSRKRVLKAIARLPEADENQFLALMQAATESDRHDNLSDDLCEVVLNCSDGYYACQRFPNHVADLFKSRYLLSRPEADRVEEIHPGIPIPAYSDYSDESRFGVRERLPLPGASALSGPFLPLLKTHPAIGVQLILDLTNHLGGWLADRSTGSPSEFPTFPIAFALSDGTESHQWANGHLWQVYRGTSVFPTIVSSALMALERWLLERCKAQEDVTSWMIKILQGSNNVMPTAVLASVCTAYPVPCKDTALTFLASRAAVQLDRNRLSQDYVHLSILPTDSIQRTERQQSNQLQHRRMDLEALAIQLQYFGIVAEVHSVIDAHISELPEIGKRTDDQLLWRLALHRMDFRDWGTDQPQDTEQGAADNVGTVRVSLMWEQIDPDVRSYSDKQSVADEPLGVALRLQNWRASRWAETTTTKPTDDWRGMLSLAQELLPHIPNLPWFATSACVEVAAVCVRDDWEEMDEDGRQWCTIQLISELQRSSREFDLTTRHLQGAFTYSMFPASRPAPLAAYVLPKMLSCDTENVELISVLAHAVTDPSLEVRLWACEGAAAYLYPEHADLVFHCIGAVAMLGALFPSPERPLAFHSDPSLVLEAQFHSASRTVRQRFLDKEIKTHDELERYQFTDGDRRQEALPLFALLKHLPELVSGRTFFANAVEYIVQSWDERRGSRFSRRDSDFETAVSQQFAEFVLTLPPEAALECCKPFLDAALSHPENISWFIMSLVNQEDQANIEGIRTCFWPLWEAFANSISDEAVQKAAGLGGSGYAELIGAVFFGGYWKDDIRRWTPIVSNEAVVDELVLKLSSTAVVLHAYARYLYNIGESALPEALNALAQVLRSCDAKDVSSKPDIMFYTESVLQRCLHTHRSRIEGSPQLRESVLSILDHLVEAGSRSAYRLRDDFATPAR